MACRARQATQTATEHWRRFLINMGIASKGRDCEAVGANHHWYNSDNVSSACYHCEVIRPGQLWRRPDSN